MAESDSGNRNLVESNLTKQEWEGLIRMVDSKIESPEQRSERVRLILAPVVKDISNWDMICFCLSFLATQFMDYPVFMAAVKRINRVIYQMHYQIPHEIGLIKEDKGKLTQLENFDLL